MLEIVTSLIPSRLIRTLRLKKTKKTFRGRVIYSTNVSFKAKLTPTSEIAPDAGDFYNDIPNPVNIGHDDWGR